MITEWHVAFLDRQPGAPRQWWDVFTRPGWRHVLAMGLDLERDRWVVVDPLWDGLVVEVLSTEAEFAGLLTALAPRLTACLRVKPGAERSRLPRLGAWCVPTVAALLGLRVRALGPAGLYRQLLKRGAKPSFQEMLSRGIDLQRAEDAQAGPGGGARGAA